MHGNIGSHWKKELISNSMHLEITPIEPHNTVVPKHSTPVLVTVKMEHAFIKSLDPSEKLEQWRKSGETLHSWALRTSPQPEEKHVCLPASCVISLPEQIKGSVTWPRVHEQEQRWRKDVWERWQALLIFVLHINIYIHLSVLSAHG